VGSGIDYHSTWQSITYYLIMSTNYHSKWDSYTGLGSVLPTINL